MIWDHVTAVLMVLAWLGCGYVAAGILYADARAEARSDNPGWVDWAFSMFFMLIGAACLTIVTLRQLLIGEPFFKDGICWNWITRPVLAAAQDNFTQNLAAAYCMPVFGANPKPEFGGLPKTEQTEPITAYRVWKLNADGKLCSAYKSHIIWPPRKRLETDDFENAGIHAVKDIHRLAGLSHKQRLWQEYNADVAGEVYLWGTVKEHVLGYTAQYAYPKQLWMPEDSDPLIVMQLEEHYGVPVTLRKEFKKPAREVIDDYQAYMAVPPGGWQGVYFSPGQVFSYVPATPQCKACGYLNPNNPSGLCSSCELDQLATTNAYCKLVMAALPTQVDAVTAAKFMAGLDQKLLPPAPDPDPNPATQDSGISGSST